MSGVGDTPVDGLPAGGLAGVGDTACPEAQPPQILADLLDLGDCLGHGELGHLGGVVLSLVAHEPELDARGVVVLLDGGLDGLGVVTVDVPIEFRDFGLAERLDVRVEQGLPCLELLDLLKSFDELEAAGAGPGRADHLHVAEVQRVALPGLPGLAGLDDLCFLEPREAGLGHAGLDLLHDQLAVTDEVVGTEYDCRGGLAVDDLAVAVSGQDLDILLSGQREVETLLVAGVADDLERPAERRVDDPGVFTQDAATLVDARRQADDHRRVLGQDGQDVQDAVAGATGLEAGADERVGAVGAAALVARGAPVPLRVGLGQHFGDTVLSHLDEQLAGFGGVAAGGHVSCNHPDAIRLLFRAERFGVADDVHVESIDLALEAHRVGGVGQIDVAGELAAVQAADNDVAVGAQLEHLGKRAIDRGDLSGVRDDGERDFAQSHPGKAALDVTDDFAEVVDVVHVPEDARRSAGTHDPRDEVVVVVGAVADHRHCRAELVEFPGDGERTLLLLPG